MIMPRKKLTEAEKERLMEIEARSKESLTFEEVGLLLNACDVLKERALLELDIETGIRREDVVGIELMNVKLDEMTILFWEEKKDYPHTVFLSNEVITTLKMYINTLPKGERFLFPAEKGSGKHMSGRHAYNVLQRNVEKAGIKKHLEFHALRRTFVRLSKLMGRDMKFVMEQTNDTARTLVEEYEGYSIDDMKKLMERDSILKRVHKGQPKTNDAIKKKIDEQIEFLQFLKEEIDKF